MDKILLGIIAITVGLATIKWRKVLVRSGVEGQNKTFGFHFGEKEIQSGERAAPFIGIFAIAGGIYSIIRGLGWL